MGVYKRGKTWYMDFYVEGHRVNRSTGCTRKSQALDVEKAEYNRLLERLEQEEQTYNPRILLSEAARDVYEEKWKHQANGERAVRYVQHIVGEFGDIALDEINRAWVRKVGQGLFQTRSTATVNRYLAHLRMVLNWAKNEWGVVSSIPQIRLYKESAGRTRVITPEEQAAVTQYLREHYKPSQWYWPTVADLVDFLCETGLRLSEALNLTPKNFRRNGAIELFPEDTKTYAARTVPLSARAQELIEKRGHSPFKEIDKFQAGRAFKHARDALGIQESDFCLHACRHTFASRLLASGQVQLYHIKTLLGHTAWSTTERYSHFATSELESAVSVLDKSP